MMRTSYQGAVLGFPVKQSLSPAIFGYLSDHFLRAPYESSFHYGGIEIAESEFQSRFAEISSHSEFKGCNVTLPFKERVISQLDEISQEAREIGAVNVVHRKGETLLGFNTDVYGIGQTLKECSCSLAGEAAVVFGAGGAARAVGYALAKAGASHVHFVNRTLARAQKLAEDLGVFFPRTEFQASTRATGGPSSVSLYVNATPYERWNHLGLTEGKSFLPQNPDPKSLAFDLIYRPRNTPFLEWAQSHGLKTVGGLSMLIWQALASWEIWFGPLSEKGNLKATLYDFLNGILDRETLEVGLLK